MTSVSQTTQNIPQSSSLPPPGPDYYAARRRLWLTPRVPPPPPTPDSGSRKRLEDLMNRPGAVHNQEIWHNHIEQIWKGISSGGRLKLSLPLSLIIKILHAAWLRDQTWPAGMEAPDTDEEQEAESTTQVQT